MDWLLLSVFVAACFSAGLTGGLFQPGEWYRNLKKPSWTPPDLAFPIVWFALYACMSVAATRVAVMPDSQYAMAFWALQIALNGLWTPVFFGLKKIRMGLFVVSLLWLAVLAAMIALWQLDTVAGLLFAPYLLWVSIAAALNATIWRLNPEAARNS